ncbi:hypothetical protein [Marininema halotolerans]|uniref:Uncharacterized protein n=1 Tax=Marininema halotolerans TaxID=1155944 RepID=A0A1I6ULN4_9BACL|nr:hypothetical protein [Marininema halotolerans]SFT02362.1 hypothetical protein SAMN05444972_1189 [Marininema halotolerans]
MEIEIIPYQGIIVEGKDISLGMKRNEIWEVLGKPISQFKKTYLSEQLTDEYTGMHVFYNNEDKCVAIEMNDSSSPEFKGSFFFDKKFDEIKRLFVEMGDDSLEVDDSGLTSIKYGIGIYIPDIEENGNVDGVIVFKKGYYED